MAARGTTLVNVALVALVILTVAALLWWKSAGSDTSVSEPPRPPAVAEKPADRPETATETLSESLTASPDAAVERALVDASGAAPSATDATKAPIANIEGTVLSNRKPLHDATVFYGPVGAENDKSASGQAYTNREGKFTIRPVRDAQHQLMVTKDGYSVGMAVAKPGTPITVELSSASSEGSLSGRLVDSRTREPITAFRLSIQWKKSKNSWQASGGRDITDSGGWFHEPLKIARDDIEISIFFTASGYRDAIVSREHVKRLENVDLGEVAIEKLEGVREGIVVDDRDGSPIPGAQVTPISDQGFPEDRVITGEDGRFTIERMRAKALSGFAAAAEGFATLYFPLASQAGDPPVLRLTQGVEIRGKVIVEKPASETWKVGYWSEEGASPFPGMPHLVSEVVTPDPSGEYVLKHVPPRTVLVGLRRIPDPKESGRGKTSHEQLSIVDLSDGRARVIDFVVGRGQRVRGKIVAKGRAGNVVAIAMLLRPDGTTFSMIESNVGADFEFSDVPTGNFVLRLCSSKERHVDKPVTVGTDPVKLGDVDMSGCFVKR